jgi:transcription initiation factor TFIIH subunit 1
MSRSSEEILLQVAHVKHKKSDGTLYLMGERMGWMPAGRGSKGFNIVHKYADIRSQKISPEGKPKIQLQVKGGGNCPKR